MRDLTNIYHSRVLRILWLTTVDDRRVAGCRSLNEEEDKCSHNLPVLRPPPPPAGQTRALVSGESHWILTPKAHGRPELNSSSSARSQNDPLTQVSVIGRNSTTVGTEVQRHMKG